MDTSMDGRSAIVTGGSRGIGKAIAAELARAGAQVMIVSRKIDACEAAASEIGANAYPHAAHVGDHESVEACVDEAVARCGTVDVLVNSAGVNPYMGPTAEIDMGRWEKLLQVNLTGPLRLAQIVWQKSMQGRTGSSIINIASTAGTSPTPLGPYGVTKAALIHMTAQLAAEMGPAVRVNAIAPGVVRTEFARPMWEGDTAGRLEAQYPMQRFGECHDIASAALFLASDAATWITGHTLVVDGGRDIAIG